MATFIFALVIDDDEDIPIEQLEDEITKALSPKLTVIEVRYVDSGIE